MNEALIAPCGMNCGICSAYLAYQNELKSKGVGMPYCTGCRERNKQCSFIKKGCDLVREGRVQYCHECPDFPCKNLARLDSRYRSRYRMSMIENLEYIRDHGIAAFLETDQRKWQCPRCGASLCCHNGLCFNCDLEELKNKRYRYRWEES